jgi:hypothetical protein
MSETIKVAAYEYWRQGCNIVLLHLVEGEKKPLHEWKKWQNERQTETEFKELPWSEAIMFAVVCGTQLNDCSYFAAIDYDVKNLEPDIVAKGAEIVKTFLTTQTEQTPSKGCHLVYHSKKKPDTLTFNKQCALELLGSGKLCIMYPSSGYAKLNDNGPSVLEDVQQTFLKAMPKDLTVKAGKTAWFDRQDLRQGYKGQHPPCITVLMRGTSEGSRNDYGIRLASYLLNFRKYQAQTVQKMLKDWNKLNTPSLDPQKLDELIRTVSQGQYVYGCRDEVLEKLCNCEGCPICSKTVVLSDEQKRRAEEVLERSDLLNIVLTHGKKRLIGEDSVLLINFVEICSGQTQYPISGVISGFSGSGKNESIRAVKELIPEEWLFEFTTSTPEAIKYLPEEFSGTLVIYESSGVSNRTGTGAVSLRAVGEGESIETIYPMKDELTGKMSLGRAKTNARNFLTTDSGIDIQADLYRRVLKHTMRSDRILTRRVCVKEMRECYLPESLRRMIHGESSDTVDLKEFKNALRVQDWKAEVVVFVPKELLSLVQVALTIEQQVAIRTQFKKILSFIQVLALLNQKHRERFTVGEKKYVIAGPNDYRLGLAILSDTILETISRVEERQKTTLELFKGTNQLTKNDVAEKLHVSGVTAARALQTLANSGYLKEYKTSRPYSYQKIRDKPDSLVILTDTSQYDSFYHKELEYYRINILSLVTRDLSKSANIVQNESPSTILPDLRHSPETSDKIPSEVEPSLPDENKPKPFVLSPMTSENKPKPKLASYEAAGQVGLILCPYCRNLDKEMFFVNDVDLRAHMSAWHKGSE